MTFLSYLQKFSFMGAKYFSRGVTNLKKDHSLQLEVIIAFDPHVANFDKSTNRNVVARTRMYISLLTGVARPFGR